MPHPAEMRRALALLLALPLSACTHQQTCGGTRPDPAGSLLHVSSHDGSVTAIDKLPFFYGTRVVGPDLQIRTGVTSYRTVTSIDSGARDVRVWSSPAKTVVAVAGGVHVVLSGRTLRGLRGTREVWNLRTRYHVTGDRALGSSSHVIALSGDGYGALRLIALDPATGAQRWRVVLHGAAGASRLLLRGGVVYVAAGTARPDEPGSLTAHRVDDGRELWRVVLRKGDVEELASDGDDLVVALADAVLGCA